MEGIGGLIIGAAAVLLAVKFFKDKKAEAQAGAPALPAVFNTEPSKPTAVKKRAPARRAQPAKSAAAKSAAKGTGRAKPASKTAKAAPKATAKPESTES